MPSVRVREGESVESAIRRLKRLVEKLGLSKELRKREFHEKASSVRKRKAAAARKRHLKKLAREQNGMQHRGNERSGERGKSGGERGKSAGAA